MFGAGASDDGLSTLSPQRYLEIRVGDQLRYFRGRTAKLERQLHRLQFATVAAGGLGTLLAALGLELWIGLTTSFTGAVAAWIGSLQIDNTLVTYNQAASRLDGLQTRWLARPAADPDGTRFDTFVQDAEDALEVELSGWVQQMNEALERRRAQAEPANDPSSPPASQ